MTRIVDRLGLDENHNRPQEKALVPCKNCDGLIEVPVSWGLSQATCGPCCKELFWQEVSEKAQKKREAHWRRRAEAKARKEAVEARLGRVFRPARRVLRPITRRLEAFTDWAEGRA